jgi:hypothetical protein
VPNLRTYKVFISHRWNYDEDYRRIERFLAEAPRFDWVDLSVPKRNPIHNAQQIAERLEARMREADVFIIIAGMYVLHSDWIERELAYAREIELPVIGIRKWGSERVPDSIQRAARQIVGWNGDSIVSAIRDCAKPPARVQPPAPAVLQGMGAPASRGIQGVTNALLDRRGLPPRPRPAPASGGLLGQAFLDVAAGLRAPARSALLAEIVAAQGVGLPQPPRPAPARLGILGETFREAAAGYRAQAGLEPRVRQGIVARGLGLEPRYGTGIVASNLGLQPRPDTTALEKPLLRGPK